MNEKKRKYASTIISCTPGEFDGDCVKLSSRRKDHIIIPHNIHTIISSLKISNMLLLD
jgi:hypothetical protein